jgi:hypothetical protein
VILLPNAPRRIASHAFRALQNLGPRNRVLARNEALRGAHRGERCFVLGSGGSILTQDLTLLRGERVITQNNFHVHEAISVIAPSYHCVVPMYQPPKYAPDWTVWFTSMQERLPQTTRLIAGLSSKALLEKHGFFRDRVHYLRQGLEPALLRRPPFDLTRNVMNIETALTQCLEAALFMEFAKIYLLGFDLSQVCEGRDREWGRFYGTSPVTQNAAERSVDELYMSSGMMWLQYWLMWRSFELLRQEGERRGVEIVNLTRGGLLTMFPRASYEEVIRS